MQICAPCCSPVSPRIVAGQSIQVIVCTHLPRQVLVVSAKSISCHVLQFRQLCISRKTWANKKRRSKTAAACSKSSFFLGNELDHILNSLERAERGVDVLRLTRVPRQTKAESDGEFCSGRGRTAIRHFPLPVVFRSGASCRRLN